MGSNYLAVEFKPSSDGGLSTGSSVELRSKEQGLFQFVSVLEKTRERAIYMKRQMQEEEANEGLRASTLSHSCLLNLMVCFSCICIAFYLRISR